MDRFTKAAILLGTLCLTAAACSDNSSTTTTTPTPTPLTDTFSGTLTPNGGATYQFTALASGIVTATLSALDGDSPPTIGLSLGTWNGNACAIRRNWQRSASRQSTPRA